MRIFSNFDTRLKARTFRKYQEEFGKEHVALITKGRLFWFVHVFAPILIYLFFAGLFALVLYFWVSQKVFLYGGIPMIIIGCILMLTAVVDKYIAYKMDFVVITPIFLIRYDQNGFFARSIMTINTINIKTISVAKDGLLYSIFNTGDLIFLSEGADMIHGEIIIHYIAKPEKMRHRIYEIMKGSMRHTDTRN